MPLMSRFRKDKQDDEDPLAGIEEEAEEEEEGLFMSTKLTPGGAPSDEGEAGEDDVDGDVEDLLETARAEDAAIAQDVAPDAEDADAGEGSEEAAGDGGGDGPVIQTAAASPVDDALSLFRAEASTSDIGELTKHVEDVPIEELLAELRELRALLAIRPTGAENESEVAEGAS